MKLTATEQTLEDLDNAIRAAEDWHKNYTKDPESLAKLIKIETRLETLVRRFFKNMSLKAETFVNWSAYEKKRAEISAAKDFIVEVIIEDGPIGAEDSVFVETVFDPIAQAVALGAITGENVYSYDLGLSETSAAVQRVAREKVAELVGKRLDGNGNIIDNPKADYRISDKTRKDIRESIRTSLSLGEDQTDATSRLKKTIADPKRAAMIARTETVNAYNRGLLEMGRESGAVGKEWQSVNIQDICWENEAAGVIGIDELFPSGHDSPAAHPNCRCSMVLIYPEDSRAKKLITN